jgi:hypothetical protein
MLDGMLTKANPATQIIDGWEYSYDYKTEQQFIIAQEKLSSAFGKVSSMATREPKLPTNYTQSFGLWIDYQDKIPKWHPTDFSQNYFTPAEFKNSLKIAQKHASSYVWIYSQKPDWFTKQNLPEEYIQAITQSRE